MPSKSPNDDPLDDLLQNWRVNSSLPVGFEKEVWRRIDKAQAKAKPSLWETLSLWIAQALPRPALAATYIAALMVIGVSAGWTQAHQDSARLKAELGDRYVHVLDPYLPRQSAE